MFIQVYTGKVGDEAALKASMDAWMQDLAPGAEGWLGATGGATDDGRYVNVVRFESEEAARRNSGRPEQGTWWNEQASKAFSGDVTFYDCPTVRPSLGGGSDDAGFVQVMIGKTSDPDAMLALAEEFDKVLPQHRPDVIGGTLGIASDGTFVETNYFRSEAEAREGESKDRPPEVQELFDRLMGLVEGDITYLDLKSPQFYSA